MLHVWIGKLSGMLLTCAKVRFFFKSYNNRLSPYLPFLLYTCIINLNVTFYLCILDRASLWKLKNKRPTWCHLLFYFTSYVLNMSRTSLYPSSGVCDCSVQLPHWSYCSWFDVCWSFGVVGLEWYPCCRLQPATRIPPQTSHTETPTHIETRTIRPMW